MAKQHNKVIKLILTIGSSWFAVHAIFPLVPFIIVTLLRYSVAPSMSLKHFNASELALSLGLMTMFARQSILNREILLSNSLKEKEVKMVAAWLLIIAVFPLSFFLSIEIVCALNKPILILQVLTIFFTIIIFVFLISLQEFLDLDAELK